MQMYSILIITAIYKKDYSLDFAVKLIKETVEKIVWL